MQSQCNTAVGNGVGESGCQIGLDDITHVGYCTSI